MRAGKPVTLAVREDSLEQFIYHASPVEQFILSRSGGKAPFTFEKQLLAVEKSTAYASATIKNSLYLAAKDTGMSDNLIMEMAAILGWDIDFAYGIRSGDRFTIIYEEEYVDGEKLRDGDITAVHFYNDGKHHHIVSYTDSKNKKGFYSANGKSVRKPFLRNPLEFAYISSHFNPRRRHPILHEVRAHKGVDYAAARGTPVRAAGDGVITLRGRKGGYGKTVVIRHGQTYQTLYAHLSRFASKQRIGSRVKQGQVIGYVGSTGLSTGPHLHYEFRVNGVHKNPVKVKLPDAKPLPATEMKRFREAAEPLLAKLDLLSKAYLASLEGSTTAP